MIRRKLGRMLFSLLMVGGIAFGSAQAFGPQPGQTQLANGCVQCALCNPILGGVTDMEYQGVCIYCCQVP